MKRLFIIGFLVTLVATDKTYDEIYGHLKNVESFCLRGYIPRPASGVTVATGVDLGQWNEKQLKTMGVPSDIITKIKGYLGYKTKAEVEKAHKNPKNLVLTLNEAQRLDKPFLDKNIKDLTPYFGKMTAKGKAVLISIRHWNGSLKNSKEDGKLTVRDAKGQLVSYVWDAVKNKSATDDTLLTALKNTRSRHKSGSVAYNRLGNEIDYLDGSKPTPADYCYECTVKKDKDYCY